jgi:hypothetical protein
MALTAVTLLLVLWSFGALTSASAQEFRFKSESANAQGLTTGGIFFFLDVRHSETRTPSGDFEDWQVFAFVSGVCNFFASVPVDDIDIGFGAGEASANTVAGIMVNWQATGPEGRSESRSKFEFDGIEQEFRSESRNKPASASGTLCGRTIGTVFFAEIREDESRSEF